MNIETYQYFQELANDRNVTRAAKKVGLTQQALSAQINRLEQYYNVCLFDRENHFNLTYAGEKLLEYCQQLNSWDIQVRSEMKEIANGNKGIIKIGTTAKRGYFIIPLIFGKFHEEFPYVQVSVIESRSSELLSNVLEQNTDFCYMVNQVDNPRITTVPIFDERIQLFVTDNLLRKYCQSYYNEIVSSHGKGLPLAYFAKCPFLMQGPSNRVRINCDKAFERKNIRPNIILTSTNAMNLLKIAQQGIGAAFLVESTRIEDNTQHVYRINIQELSHCDQLKVCYLKDYHLPRPAQRFIELSQKILPEFSGS